MRIFLLSLLLISSLFANKVEIYKEIDSISLSKFEDVYVNVLKKFEAEGNSNAIKYLMERENMKTIILNYKRMLKTISYIESNFKYKIGFQNKNDVSYFQINIASHLWNVKKLSDLTGKEVTRDKLLDNIKFSSVVALHILIYNIGIHANYNKYNPSIENMIAAYHNPVKVNYYYLNQAKMYLKEV